jgi:hypothetical protein
MYTPEQIEKMKGIGSEWEKSGKRRIYFNNLQELYGLKTSHYNTGNVSGAELDGATISNSQAKKILQNLVFAKFWYDFSDDKLHARDLPPGYFDKICETLKTKLAEGETQ